MRNVIKQVLAALRNVEWILSLAEFVKKYMWLELGGVSGLISLKIKTQVASEWLLVVGLVLAAGCFYMAWKTQIKDRAEELENASFDMPIREAINYLVRTAPHSFDRSSLSDRLAFKKLHERMCSGELPVIGATKELDVLRPISPEQCHELVPEEQVVPKHRSTPEGVRFLMIQYVDPDWEDDWDGLTQPQVVVKYTDLRVRSVDLCNLWPRAGVFL